MRIIKYFLLIILISVLCSCANSENTKSVTINNKKIKIEIADTAETRYQGLSDKEELCDNCGMLFIFPDKQIRTFVMRDMNFPLDMVWIDDNKIVKINKNTIHEASNSVMRYSSDVPVNYVLEVNGGFCDGDDIKTGDNVEFDL